MEESFSDADPLSDDESLSPSLSDNKPLSDAEPPSDDESLNKKVINQPHGDIEEHIDLLT